MGVYITLNCKLDSESSIASVGLIKDIYEKVNGILCKTPFTVTVDFSMIDSAFAEAAKKGKNYVDLYEAYHEDDGIRATVHKNGHIVLHKEKLSGQMIRNSHGIYVFTK